MGLEWTVAGFGDFSGRANETDMLMRNSNTGAFEVYDISNNTITWPRPMGQVGLEWQVAGFGDFSTRANETDMLLRNSNNGAFEVYDIVNNTITSAQPMGQVGLEWTIAGFGDFSGNANETDMLMRNSKPVCLNSTTSATIQSPRQPRWARSAWNGRLVECQPILRSRRQAHSSAAPQSIQRPRRSVSFPRRWRRLLRLVPRPGCHRQSVKLHRQRQSVPTC